MSDIENRPRYNNIDLVKFIMALFVVAIHTVPFSNNTNPYFLTFYNMVVGLAVPFFFLASGYLLGKKIFDSDDTKKKVDLTRKKLLESVKMYLFWSIAYTPFAIYSYCVGGKSFINSVVHYIKNLVFVGHNHNSWHLWYLLSVVYALVVILILLRIGAKPRYFILIAVTAAFVSIGIDFLVQYNNELPGILLFLKKGIIVTVHKGRIFQGLIYIPIGICLANRRVSVTLCSAVFALGFICNYFIEIPEISSILDIVTSIAFFGIVTCINLKNRDIYPVLRSISTRIYLIHMYVWIFYSFILYGDKHFGMDSFVVTALLSCIISYIYLIFERKWKKHRRSVI